MTGRVRFFQFVVEEDVNLLGVFLVCDTNKLVRVLRVEYDQIGFVIGKLKLSDMFGKGCARFKFLEEILT